MKRKHFLIITALLAWGISLMMMIAPASFAGMIAVLPPSGALSAWTTFIGTNLFAIGVINVFAATSGWNRAVLGVLVGNIVLHILGLAFDWTAFNNNIISFPGVMQVTVMHLLLIAGFGYYAFNRSTHDTATA